MTHIVCYIYKYIDSYTKDAQNKNIDLIFPSPFVFVEWN